MGPIRKSVMSKINTLIIELVEAVLKAEGKLDDDQRFSILMDRLISDTDGFWEEHKAVIPEQYKVLFKNK